MNKFLLLLERNRYWISTFFWIAVWVLYSLKNFKNLMFESFLLSAVILVLYTLFTYVIVHLIDILLLKEKIYLIPAAVVLLFPVILLIVYLWVYVFLPMVGVFAFKKTVDFEPNEFLVNIGTEYGKLLLFYVTPVWLFSWLIRIISIWHSYQRGFGLLNDQVKRSRMSMHLERNTLSFILYVTRVGQSVHTATLLEMYLDVKVYIEEVSQLSLPFKPIKTEMAYVEKMLDFYCLRYRKQDAVQLTVSGRYSGQIIPALVLLTIIENIGTYADLTRPAAARIELELHNDGYTFRSWNTKKTGAVAITEPTGRGMQFVHEQLQTHLAGKYVLEVQDLETTYQLELNVNLNNEQHARDDEESTTAR